MFGNNSRFASRAWCAKRRTRSSRRGVLLLVVLSMLVLFMFIGTAYMMSSSQSYTASKASGKFDRLGNHATKLIERALLQIVRDTDNKYSVVHYHSLLRDLYGTSGFQGVGYIPPAVDLTTIEGQATRFAGAIADDASTSFREDLGQTQGQFIDIYVRQLGWDVPNNASLNDPHTTTIDESLTPGKLLQPDARHVIKLERGALGEAQLQPLPLTKGYYNGSLLTITSGPAAGQTARILDYEYVGDIQPINTSTVVPTFTRLFRFRVMSFQRADGQPLQITTDAARMPEIVDLAGAAFIVNGRAFGGTGVGYNPLALTGQPKLSALQLLRVSGSEYIGAELALLPNAVYLNPLSMLIGAPPPAATDPFGTPLPLGQLSANQYQLLNILPAGRSAGSFSYYPDYAESYDAADFQNMFLALQTVSPRAQGRVWQTGSTMPLSPFDPTLDRTQFLRLDLEDLPLPSFHRPDLVNFWYHRLLKLLTDPNGQFAMSPDEAALAILDPYPGGTLRAGLNPAVGALVAAIKRQVSLRPLREDHPNFDGGNRMSVPTSVPTSGLTLGTVPNLQLAIPYWEAVGPWDVDNDNDGVPDSIWVDLGDPIQEAEDGTRYKTLYAFLIIDLDSRLNVNAHGLADHINPAALAVSYDPVRGLPMTGAAAKNLAGQANSNVLAQGLGYGPAEISLRPVFPAPTNPAVATNRSEAAGYIDDYVSLFVGRLKQDGTSVTGRHGAEPAYLTALQPNAKAGVTPGRNYQHVLNAAMPTGEAAQPDLVAQLKFFGYPWAITQASAFGTPPDLFGRYSMGLDYVGQPVWEVLNDRNASDNTLPRPLLTDSPYEIDLSRSQRRDNWAPSFADSNLAFQQSLNQNDDAPYSPTDLEKVLRAWDADAGTLPSRLWDTVNAFDPEKLENEQYGDPVRVRNISQIVFNSTDRTERLTTAQQIAAVNRRLVTTDSFDLPVVGEQMPAYISELGADGAPGQRGIDDDPDGIPSSGNNPNGTPDDAIEIGAPGSDDFQALTGTKYSDGTIVDVLRYRIQRDRTSRGIPPFNLLVPAEKLAFDTLTSQLAFQELAPDLVAGIRMDLNRPFGDGVDSPLSATLPGNGVVDDPLESGEPFLDVNGNGKRDDGTNGTPVEPFIDLLSGDSDGDGMPYDGPRDQPWANLTASGSIGEPISFDYTNGVAVPVHKDTTTGLNLGASFPGGVRNLESQGRQQYARNLYCLMMLLVDENYIAPWDENDPQLTAWADGQRASVEAALTAGGWPAATVKAQADVLVKRKLTCRTIAQWAVNCVDKRDADVICTPFEYDENPWDGWGTLDTSNAAAAELIPLDGDAATDENKGEVIDWSSVATNAVKKVTQLASAKQPAVLNQTRGIVWGAERPELLITETLAFHDRKTEDLISNDSDGHGEIKTRSASGPAAGDRHYQDIDLDQGMRPQGSAFVEVFNPWSQQGQYPAELYTRLDITTGYQPQLPNQQGVDLTRLSNLAWDDVNQRLTTAASNTNAGNSIKRSPVWRMIVVEEWPNAKNTGDTMPGNRRDISLPPGYKEPKAYSDVGGKLSSWAAAPNGPPPFVPTDPDFDLFFGSDMYQRVVGGNIAETRMVGPAYGANGIGKQNGDKNEFYIAYPYIEREWYFTTDRSPVVKNGLTGEYDRDFSNNRANFKLRIPDRSIKVGGMMSTAPNVQTQRFPPIAIERANPLTRNHIAPILPQHYGVIGSAGTNYEVDPSDPFTIDRTSLVADATKQTYTSTIGREEVTGQANTADQMHQQAVLGRSARRIELRPAYDPSQPLTQQVLVGSNGGDPNDKITMGGTYDPYAKDIGRDNEIISESGIANNVSSSQNGDGTTMANGQPNNRYFLPAVTIPVDGMNVSEPPWGYGPREKEAGDEEAAIKKSKGGSGTAPKLTFRRTNDHKEGRYFGPSASGTPNMSSFDKPLDTAPEVIRTGTTANYRIIHLQRLANPLLPWNPPPLLADGKTANPEHRANLPINPYVTVDSASVNLTVFNGASNGEGDIDHTTQKNEAKMRPWVYGQGVSEELTDYLTNFRTGKQAWYFRSQERGFWSRLNLVGSKQTPPAVDPQRVLWAQEPANVILKKSSASEELLDLIGLRQMTMRYDEVPDGPAGDPDAIRTNQKILKNRCNMVLEHSLGFGNESFGLLYDRTPNGIMPAARSPVTSAIGTPAPARFLFTHNVNTDGTIKANPTPTTVASTNPWLEWGNRPYVSAEELLNVPAGSQTAMLRLYTAGAKVNPYDGTGLDGTGQAAKNLARLANMRSPFGHLLNACMTASAPAAIFLDPMGAPVLDASGGYQFIGAPHFYRILDFVRVPSRYVGTDTMLNAETFNDVPGVVDTIGLDITSPADPRYAFQPPFNKVSRERDPGRVNLNTVLGRRAQAAGSPPQIWSDVFDGIMHRDRDMNLVGQAGHLGPAWRDIVLSRRGYVQVEAGMTMNPDGTNSVDKRARDIPPDVFTFGLNPNFPSVFSNPFRSPNAGDLVPLPWMMHYGVDAGWLRRHHFNRGGRGEWGSTNVDDDDLTNQRFETMDDTREAGFGGDDLVVEVGRQQLLPVASQFPVEEKSGIPLLSESFNASCYDGNRNAYNYYQPASRLGNVVTNRSNVFAVWVTVGYFEVEPALDFATNEKGVRERLGGDSNPNSPASQAALTLYNRVYPDGYMLGREVGSDTGDVKRPRGFYIIDRTEEVGFKPGEDLNVEKLIRLRRRIE